MITTQNIYKEEGIGEPPMPPDPGFPPPATPKQEPPPAPPVPPEPTGAPKP